MGENSTIEWTHHTFNPWWGCTKVPGDPACHNCYAEALSHRFGLKVWGRSKPRRELSEANWRKPVTWNRRAAKAGERHRVFCASMADVFEDRRDLDPMRERLWRLIEATPNLDWLLLTKRPENLGWLDVSSRSNVWLGVTAATQAHYDERWPILAQHPAAVRFISAEPLMEETDLRLDAMRIAGVERPEWVIVGGESGPKARPMAQGWARRLRDQCVEGGVAFHFKQWGGRDKKAAGRLLDGRTWDELPKGGAA